MFAIHLTGVFFNSFKFTSEKWMTICLFFTFQKKVKKKQMTQMPQNLTTPNSNVGSLGVVLLSIRITPKKKKKMLCIPTIFLQWWKYKTILSKQHTFFWLMGHFNAKLEGFPNSLTLLQFGTNHLKQILTLLKEAEKLNLLAS